VRSSCAPGDPGSGLAALTGAGFGYAFAPSGLVCQIDGRPDPCPRVPPITAYWSYWHAQPGGTWRYSSVGAGSYDPAPGAVEGWAFGAGAPPGIAPPAATPPPAPAPVQPPAPPPSPQPAQPTGQRPSTAPSQPAPGGPGGSGAAPVPGGPGSPAAGTAAGSSAAATGQDGSSVGVSSPARTDAEVSAAAGRDAGASGTGRTGLLDAFGTAAGALLVGVLAWLAWRRGRGRASADGASPE